MPPLIHVNCWCARWGFRIWDGVDLRDELFLNYEHLPAEAKARIPLERVRVLNEDALS